MVTTVPCKMVVAQTRKEPEAKGTVLPQVFEASVDSDASSDLRCLALGWALVLGRQGNARI